jgi:uncharacterized membrane protein
MFTPTTFKKHPLHPLLVGMPIGLWIFSLVCDAVAFFGWGGSTWKDVAYYTMAGGIVTALIAAIPGFIDLLSFTDARLKRIGVIHMIVNLVVVGLYVINLALRPSESNVPLLLSVIGVVLLFAAGWLGGELVHVHGVTVQDKPPPGGVRRT